MLIMFAATAFSATLVVPTVSQAERGDVRQQIAAAETAFVQGAGLRA